MNFYKFFNLKRCGRRLLVYFTALMIATGLVANQAPTSVLAMPRGGDPTDTDPIGVGNDPPAYVPPAHGFSWAMEKRFGPDLNGDGMVDYHWDPVAMKYDESYVYPTAWKITFNGCQTGNDFSHYARPVNIYRWTLDGTNLTTLSCKPTLTFTDKLIHSMALTVTMVQEEKTLTFPVQTVQVKDYFIVSIGDSYASGQGNPDIEQEVIYGPLGIGLVQVSPAVWQDERCMRSANAGPALAALALEASDPHSSVTFISFACTGATINTNSYDMVLSADDTPLWGNKGIGILGPYRGEITNVAYGDVDHYIKPQMQQVRDALAASNGQLPRQIDALLISGGGNDMLFGPLISQCILFTNCWVNDFAQIKENPINDTQSYDLYDIVDRRLGLWGDAGPAFTVPDNYAALGAQINILDPKPAHVYITQYPDPTINDKGAFNQTEQHHCRMLDDVFWPNPLNVMTDAEAETASHHAQTKLNTTIRIAVEDLAAKYPQIDWQFVDGLSIFDVDPDPAVAGKPGLYVGGPNGGQGHGYCATDNWIRRADESEKIQGPVNLRLYSLGTMHPNYSGQQVLKSRILRYMLPDLAGQSAEEPPNFSFSYSSGGLTSQPGMNGWYLRSCDGSNVCSYPKVVGQAVAMSSLTLNGASISVNDTAGCAIAGVSCSVTLSTDQKQVTYAIEISATGTYRFQFNAQDVNGQAGFLQKEIKVDLEDPILATPIGPFEVEEGGSVELSAHVATYLAGDPPQEFPTNDDFVVNFDWDLNNDGFFETEDEQPIFSAAEIDGPAALPVQVKVTDRAGRTSTAQAEVQVLDLAPAVIINGVPATVSEGTAIDLTSTVTPGEASDFTYAWNVKKGEISYASGTEASFSFTPDDNGDYEVSLSVTNASGKTGTASQAISVSNAAPALGNLQFSPEAVDEGASVSVSGSITDPGVMDSLTLSINWGDGSAEEIQSLSAGTTSFTASHTFADDDPTATASDSVAITISVMDKDSSSDTKTSSITVNNLAPTVSLNEPASGSLYMVNSTVNVTAAVSDPSTSDTLMCSVDWNDGSTSDGMMATGVCSADHIYTDTGVFTIQVTGTDDDTGSDTESVMVVVYDPSAGFVTGGGWIDSPAGAYIADPTLAGQAHFGFVSRYEKGATKPTGRTQFRFQAADFIFVSESYEWLVVDQGKTNAQFKGSGSINGTLDPNGQAFKFMLWAEDNSPDTFRIKIWWEDDAGEYVVYDNGFNQAIGGGSIVVHIRK